MIVNAAGGFGRYKTENEQQVKSQSHAELIVILHSCCHMGLKRRMATLTSTHLKPRIKTSGRTRN